MLSGTKLSKNFKVNRNTLFSAPPSLTKLHLIKIINDFIKNKKTKSQISNEEVIIQAQISMIEHNANKL